MSGGVLAEQLSRREAAGGETLSRAARKRLGSNVASQPTLEAEVGAQRLARALCAAARRRTTYGRALMPGDAGAPRSSRQRMWGAAVTGAGRLAAYELAHHMSGEGRACDPPLGAVYARVLTRPQSFVRRRLRPPCPDGGRTSCLLARPFPSRSSRWPSQARAR